MIRSICSLCGRTTGSLDSATGGSIMEPLHSLNREGMTIVMVTHNPEYTRQTHRAVNMADGHIAHIGEQHSGTGTM